jgi:signal transduction histidine kinase
VNHGPSSAQFDSIHPFHMVIDRDMALQHMGPAIAKLAPGIQTGSPFSDYFKILRPQTNPTLEGITGMQRAVFLLECITQGVTLKGQMLVDEARELIFFVGSPLMDDRMQLGEYGLTLTDFPIHDSSMDLVIFQEQQLVNKKLEDLVHERTLELEASQQTLIQSEKMAALGRVSAGMAHELNNPASAAQRAVSQLRVAMDALGRTTFTLGRTSLAPDQIERIQELEASAAERVRTPLTIDSVQRMDREAEVQDWLADHELSSLDEHAGALVDLGIETGDLDELRDLFEADALAAVLERTVEWHTTLGLIAEIGQGAGRVTEIVRALKSYTYLDQAPVQAVDVNEGLNDTLVVLHSLLKDGISVKREFDPNLPRITARGAELNQVWTNLIENAVDAMEGEGELTVRTARDGDEVMVQIIDSGPGIPSEVRDRLFDPFVTTKAIGKGTGLGLSMSRNIIVEHHGGTLDVASEPGRTCFEIRIPLDPDADSEPITGGAG